MRIPAAPHREAARDAHARTIRAWALGLVVGALALAGAGAAARTARAAAPPAGTAVDNTAQAHAQEPGGVWLNPVSNTVRAVVQAFDALALRRPQSRSAARGTRVAFAHVLTHLGNATTTYRLTLAQDAGDGYDFDAPRLLHDVDGDGLEGPLDTPLADGAGVTLAPGDSLALLVSVAVPPAAPAPAEARITLAAEAPSLVRESVTDTVRATAVTTPPALAFWSAGYGVPVRASALGAPLLVQASAPACDTDPAVRDTVTLTLSSRLTGDADAFRAIETGPNTGVFRTAPTPVTLSPPVSAPSNDGVLMQAEGDEIEALLEGCGATRSTARVWIQPGGVVFDARANTPVSGARVQLVDVSGAGNGGVPGGPARVFAYDGVTPAPSDAVTDAAGRFEFPHVDASLYRIVVTPPVTHTWPSRVAFADQPAGRTLDATGSFGGAFTLLDDGEPVRLDVPVDAQAAWALFAEKTASAREAEWGDLLEYRVQVANRSDSALASVTLDDALPHGFAYVRGSARVDGVAAEPLAGADGTLRFALGALAAGARAEVRYGARVGPGAPEGDALNRAVATAGALRSNEAIARVRVRGDALGGEALLTGTVWYDADRDGARGAGEPGMAGVRLYLDDGTFAVTDEHGRWSMTGLTPRTHALKLDPSTLPPSAHPRATALRERGTPGLRFVELTRGALVRADFAVTGDTTALRTVRERALAAATRAAQGAGAGADERARLLARGTQPLAPAAPAPDPRTLPATRVTSGDAPGVPELPRGDALAGPAAPALPAVPAAASGAAAIEQLLPTLTPALGLVGLGERDTVGGTQLSIVAKAPFGTRVELRVNGVRQGEARIGRRFTAPRAGLEAWEWIGVELRAGENLIELSAPRTRESVSARVVAPGAFARLELDAPRTAHADGRGVVPVALRVTDRAGVALAARTIVTVDAGAARFLAPDLDPVTAGWQTAVEGGRARIALLAPASPGEVRVNAASGDVQAAARIEFVPELRPLVAVGLLEGSVSLRRFGAAAGARAAAARRAAFDAPVTQFASESRDGRTAASAHGGAFVKGRVAEGLLLTLGWDSDRESGARQFRDLQTDRGYPVTGDASVRGYEAQSTGQLYARLEAREGALLYGDMLTFAGAGAGASGAAQGAAHGGVQGGVQGGFAGATQLARYSRSLTGAQGAWRRGALVLDAFTSRERSRRGVEELRGLGTSGPYVLAGAPLVENSERVEVIVRDRAQGALVKSVTTLQRFTDYTVEPLSGRVLLRAPLPGVDAELNSVWLRVSYERDGGAAAAWVHGAQARLRVHPRLEASGTVVDDHDPARPYELRGAAFEWRAGARTALAAEWAASRTPGQRAADAGRVELKHEGTAAVARAWGVSTSARFDNPSAGAGAGRNEAGATLAWRLPDRSRLNAEALFSADAAGRERRAGLLVAHDRALGKAVRGELGVRVAGLAREAVADEPVAAAIRAKLSAQWPRHPEWSGYGEFEQDTRLAERRMAAVGGEYRFSARGRLYARHELLSSLASAWALNTTQQQAASVVGVDADVSRDAHAFGEYRMSDAIAGREAQAAVGLRHGWTVAEGMRIATSLERVTPLAGSDAGPSTALTGAVDFTGDELWKGSSRFEVRTSRASDQFLQGMAAAVKLDSAWTALGRQLLTLTRTRGSAAGPGAEARERLQLAAAYRPGGKWDALLRWEFAYERGGAGASGTGAGSALARRVANIAGAAATVQDGAWEHSFGWAGKLTRQSEPGHVVAGGAQWAHARVGREFAGHWDAAVTGGVRTGRRLEQREYGLGLELGRALAGGTWLALGFNRFGFEDDELAGEAWTRTGAYLRLRMRVDETLMGLRGGPRGHERDALGGGGAR